MGRLQRLEELRVQGRLRWSEAASAWVAQPEEVVGALTDDGFAEYRREVARRRGAGEPSGGVWEGLDTRTGSVASAAWLRPAGDGPSIVMIEIDGQPFLDSAR
jgi:hypothetical protein